MTILIFCSTIRKLFSWLGLKDKIITFANTAVSSSQFTSRNGNQEVERPSQSYTKAYTMEQKTGKPGESQGEKQHSVFELQTSILYFSRYHMNWLNTDLPGARLNFHVFTS